MHEEFDALAALEAIGGATDEESARLAAHCAGCPPCSDAAREYREASAGLAFALDPVPPRRDARDTLLRRIESEAVADSRVAEAAEAEAAAERRKPPTRWFAAAAVFFLALFGWSELRLRALREELGLLETEKTALVEANLRLASEAAAGRARLETISSADRIFRLAATDTAPAAASVFMDGTHRRAVVVFTNLEQNDAGHSYQLWILRADEKAPVSAGVFDVDDKGRAEVELRDMPLDVPVAGLAVTLEPRGGLPAPSGKVLLHGKA